MKYTSSLLKKFISVHDTPQNIAKNLILKTCEIEEINERKISDNIVIWQVTSCEKHPDADKLSVCQVNCWNKWTYQICCGGSNVVAGLYVPVALPGTVFEKAGITIEPRKMRGLDSNGMICSKEELGIMEDMEKHSIWSLTEDLEDISDTDLGTALREKFPRLENRIMEVDNKSLTNRPDLTGHFGAATELNAIYNLAEKWNLKAVNQCISFNKVKEYHDQCTPQHIMQILENSVKSEIKVIGESDDLNSYILLYIKNVNVKSAWFFSRLQTLDIGSKPINNWVDFSNLFMNISGNPVHFFDADKVDGDIIVRNAKDWEKFTDLFEAEHILKITDIVIADKKKILALAGIIWGLESGITENTKNILVEIANFNSVIVRKTGTRLWLRTDAELRFEKNINPRYTLFCLILFLDELTYYKKDLGDFDIGWLSYYMNGNMETLKHWKMIEVEVKVMEQFIFGQKIKWFDKKTEEILIGLGFTWKDNGNIEIGKDGKIQIMCPLRRGPDDLNIKEDIYEEVARIYGYSQIENLPLLSETKYTPYTAYVTLQRKLEDILVRTLWCHQVETYPRISEKALQEFGKDTANCYVLQNPINPDVPFMRDAMVYGLLSHTAKNSKFFDTFNLFDIGKVRVKWVTKDKDSRFATDFVDEQTQLGMMIYQKNIDQWDKDPILEAKHIVSMIAKELELGKVTFEKTILTQFHPKKQATIKLGDLVIGFVGSLHPLILQNQKIGENSGVVYLSLNLSKIVENTQEAQEHIYSYETLQDQIIWRDLCFVVEANRDFAAVIDAVQEVTEVQDVEVFDVYAGKNLGDDKKSVSIKIKIAGDSVAANGAGGNITTEQINEVMKKAIVAVEAVGGSLRA